jgi:hypothetical protein
MFLLRLSHCLNLLPNSNTFKLNNLLMSSCRHSPTADTQNALLLLTFNFTNQNKVEKIHSIIYYSFMHQLLLVCHNKKFVSVTKKTPLLKKGTPQKWDKPVKNGVSGQPVLE